MESCSFAKSFSFTKNNARSVHPINMMTKPHTCVPARLPPSAKTMPVSTRTTEIHVFFSTDFLIVSKTTGSTTTVIEKVNAPVETSKYFSPYKNIMSYAAFNTPSSKQRSNISFPARFISAAIRLKKQAASIAAAIAEVINEVANGSTSSGIHAKMITSVDQQSVTQIKHRFACNLFISPSPFHLINHTTKSKQCLYYIVYSF